MAQTSTIGLDIAQRVFQAHGADGAGHGAFRKRLTRAKLVEFFAAQPPAGAHHWAREIGKASCRNRTAPGGSSFFRTTARRSIE